MSVTVPMVTPGSLTSLMDGLTALQEQLVIPGLQPLAFYRWRPSSPDSPALYNWLNPSSSAMKDLSRIRDTIILSTRIGQTMTDTDQRMAEFEQYADGYRALVDANFWDGSRTPPPLKGQATWAMRSSMGSFNENFGSTTLLGIEFVQEFWLDRPVR